MNQYFWFNLPARHNAKPFQSSVQTITNTPTSLCATKYSIINIIIPIPLKSGNILKTFIPQDNGALT